MEIKPVVTKKVYQSIIEQFIDLIRNGNIQIGERLPPERDLAAMFRVSRPSVREALRVMEIIGLIETRPGGGSYVTDLNIAPFLNTIAPLFLKHEGFEVELLELRIMLELKAAELAAKNIVPENLKPLHDTVLLMEKALNENDTRLGAEADIEFHRTIFRITDNFVLSKAAEFVVSILEVSVTYSRDIILQDAKNTAVLFRQHRAIYEAIRDGDGKRARTAMEEHLHFALDQYLSRKPD